MFRHPDYKTAEQKLVAIYIFVHRDMAGVCPFRISSVANATSFSKPKVRSIIDQFQSKGKLIKSRDFDDNGGYVWWKSGIYHTLYRGKFSEKQMQSVTKLLKKRQNSGVFDENFAEMVVQVYERQYSITIPYALNMNMNMNMKMNEESGESNGKKEGVPYDEIVDDLNARTGKKFNADTRKTVKLINGRWNDGYRLDDFVHVHKVKCAEWKDTESDKYLAPPTLYSQANFEKYLNQRLRKDDENPDSGVPM